MRFFFFFHLRLVSRFELFNCSCKMLQQGLREPPGYKETDDACQCCYSARVAFQDLKGYMIAHVLSVCHPFCSSSSKRWGKWGTGAHCQGSGGLGQQPWGHAGPPWLASGQHLFPTKDEHPRQFRSQAALVQSGSKERREMRHEKGHL